MSISVQNLSLNNHIIVVDPITTAIVAAIAAVGSSAIKDSYSALKALLKNKFGEKSDLVEAVNKLEEKPQSEARKATVQEEVEAAKASDDPEVVQLAQSLLEKLKEHQAGDLVGRDKVGGDKVGGDKVGGDKITVGDVSGSTGFAFGRGATATVNTDQLQNSNNPEAQKLADLLKQLQAEIEEENSRLTPKNRGKALRHLKIIGKFGGDRQNSDLRDDAETALDALPTILSQGIGLNKAHIDALLTSIKENLGL